ncbi:MAG: MFS transporter [Clostridia bacterium]|nr:MFS transporter [Clostridia bacterium]
MKGKFSKILYDIKHNPSFTLKEQLGYASGMFGNAMGQDCVLTYSDKFNRDFMGIKPKHIVPMTNVTTLLSFFVPPVAGTLLDLPTPQGKKSYTKRILQATPLPFAITSMMLFLVPPGGYMVRLFWTFAFTVLFTTVDTFFDMALNTISLRMTTNPKDRKNFYTISSLAATLGSMLPGWLLPIVVDRFTSANDQRWAHFFVALFFCILGVSSMSAPYFTLNEKVGNLKVNESEKIRWDRRTFSAIIHNRPFVIYLLATMFETIRKVTYDLLPFLYQNTFDDYGMKAIIDMVSGTLSYAGLALVPLLGGKISARTMLVGGHAYTGFFYTLITMLAHKADIKKLRKRRYFVGIMIGLAGMPNSGMSAAQKVLIADSTDYMEWDSNRRYGTPIRSDGLLLAAGSIISHINTMIRKNIKELSLNAIGYKSGEQDASGKAIDIKQSDKTLRGIYMIVAICGMLGNFLPGLTYMFDNYTGKRQKAIEAELAEMRSKRVTETMQQLNEEFADANPKTETAAQTENE